MEGLNLYYNFGLPVPSEVESVLYSSVSPSTVHVSNSMMARYFRRYLLQKAMSVFDWTVPEEWDKDYFLYCLYILGHVCVCDVAPFGVIVQNCHLTGYNVYYHPTTALVSNPVIRDQLELKIGTETELIHLTPDFWGICDIVGYYADMLALAAESAGVNLVNSKLAYVFAAQNKAGAESLKKLFDKIQSGEPAVIIDKQILDDDGNETWSYFAQNLKQNYLLSDLLTDMRKIEMMFDADVGIPTANTEKRAQLTDDEVNVNNFENRSKIDLWLECLTRSIEKVTAMFPDLSGRLSVRMKKEVIGHDDAINSGNARV